MPPRNNRKERSSPERQTQPPKSQTQPPPSSRKHGGDIPSSSSAADNFSSQKRIVFPPGFKFVPTDEDLIFHYLKPFLQGNKNSYPNVPIHHVNMYESNPEQLSKEYEKGNDKEWFFITERTKKHESGKHRNRSDNGGTWKTNVTKKIKAGQGVVGYKTKLDYHIGEKSNSVKSDWLMYEYWFESSPRDKKSNGDNKKVDHALCKIFLTPRAEKRKAEEEETEKKKKKKKMKKEESVATVINVQALEEEVDQPRNAAFQQPQFSLPPLDSCQPHQPQLQQQQPHNYAYQQQLLPNVGNQPHQPQIFIVSLDSFQPQIFRVSLDSSLQPQAQEQQQLPILDISDELPEMINFQQQPVIPDAAAHYQDGNEEPSNRSSLEEIVREGMKKH